MSVMSYAEYGAALAKLPVIGDSNGQAPSGAKSQAMMAAVVSAIEAQAVQIAKLTKVAELLIDTKASSVTLACNRMINLTEQMCDLGNKSLHLQARDITAVEKLVELSEKHQATLQQVATTVEKTAATVEKTAEGIGLAIKAWAEIEKRNAARDKILLDIPKQLESLATSVQKLVNTAEHDSTKAMANGMLLSLIQTQKKIPVNNFYSALSPRARKAIVRAKIKWMHQVTEDNLRGIPKCGPKTKSELLSWREKSEQLDVNPSSTTES